MRPARAVYEELRSRAEGLTLADAGEKALLREFLLPLCRAVCGDHGLGDDGGVVPVGAACDLVISTDRVPTDLLARRFGLMSPEAFGRYVMRVNVSDLVAMGATPTASVVTAAFPSAATVNYVIDMMWGCYAESVLLGAPVVSGDTKSAAEESVSACVVGSNDPAKSLRRGPVRPGDLVHVTGTVGAAGAALRWYARKESQPSRVNAVPPVEIENQLLAAIVAPRPRTDLIVDLRRNAAGITGCMDITDGLGQSLVELAAASNVGVTVNLHAIPVASAADWVARSIGIAPIAIVAGIGIDLELLVVTKPDAPPPPDATLIGTVVHGDGVFLQQADDSVEPFPVTGFEHFREKAAHYIGGA